MKVYFKIWGKNKIALLTAEVDGDVYKEIAMNDVNNIAIDEIKEYLISVGEINETDELIKVD